jgi:hypothetical protein
MHRRSVLGSRARLQRMRGRFVRLVEDEHYLLAVVERPVRAHRAVRVVFADGGELFVSGPHPTTDGRTLGDLRAGDALDGRNIVAAEYEPYPYDATYDILPASVTES